MKESTIPTVHEIPGAARFNVRGLSFQLDLLDTIYAFRDIANSLNAQEGTRDHKDPYRLYLVSIIEYIHRETGVTLTYGEADWLNDALNIEFANAKKKRRDSFVGVQNSPSSTDSTPAD